MSSPNIQIHHRIYEHCIFISVPNVTSVGAVSGSTTKETSFSVPAPGVRGPTYTTVSTDAPRCSPGRSRWPSQASNHSDIVSESKSTEPLLSSPNSDSLDLEGIPPPPRPYPGPPPTIPPPPHPYKDHTLPLNPSALRMTPSSYANIGVSERGQNKCDNLHSSKQSSYPTSEISV